ncbi:MAG TPA: class I SAM-dependent methyltransferase [Acetobacteraceae bacterium]|nr:class I SAM-dependent methyltransferase [Acetobacteraceae bacterium]
MQSEDARRELSEAVGRWGPWTAHNIRLADGVFTLGEHIASPKVRRVLQVVADLAGKPLDRLRVLDLACLEAQYAIEFALHGARVTAIEGRQTNIEKARFAKRILQLDALDLVQGDVRDLHVDRYGQFDVVLCLGILYHLDVPDVFAFLERIAACSSGLAVFDTYVSLAPKRSYEYKGREYWGRDIQEHTPNEDISARKAKLWSSIDNAKSVWLTTPTLLNLLTRFGFTSAYECHVPVETGKPLDRVTIVAIKGRAMALRTCPATNDLAANECPEREVRLPSHHQRPLANLRKSATQMVPAPVRRSLKRALVSVGVMRPPREVWRQQTGTDGRAPGE